MVKTRGFCQKCGSTTSSAWEPIKPKWEPFITLPDVPVGRKKNVFCASCARSLNRRESDPMVDLFPKAKRKSEQNLTAPVVSRSSVAGKGTSEFIDFLYFFSGLIRLRFVCHPRLRSQRTGHTLHRREHLP